MVMRPEIDESPWTSNAVWERMEEECCACRRARSSSPVCWSPGAACTALADPSDPARFVDVSELLTVEGDPDPERGQGTGEPSAPAEGKARSGLHGSRAARGACGR